MRAIPIALLIGLGIAHSAVAALYHVATHGNDSNSGTEAQPFLTIQRALDAVRAGGTVHVQPGVYRERVSFKTSGTADAPILLEGAAGAVIDGGDRFAPWVPAPERGPGVFRIDAPLPYVPGALFWGDKHVVFMGDPAGPKPYSGPGWALLRKDGAHRDWDGVEALAGIQGDVVYVR